MVAPRDGTPIDILIVIGSALEDEEFSASIEQVNDLFLDKKVAKELEDR